MIAPAPVALVTLLALCSGCGGDSSPTPTQPAIAQLTGAWHGTMRPTSVTGLCSADLQYWVGSTAQFDLTLTQAGSEIAGAIDLGDGTCDLTGEAGRNSVALRTTACRPRPQTILFFVCNGTGSEFTIRSLTLDLTIGGPSPAGAYTYFQDIKMPVGGPVAGGLTSSGNVTLIRR
jgi:hypothetical protein